MTSAVEAVRKIYVRKDDYYGGDLWVQLSELPDEDSIAAVHNIAVVWATWGPYGGSTFNLTPDEARALAAALTDLAG